MTNDEAKQAFFDRVPVIWKGIKYSYISAIIYKFDSYGNLVVSAELFDKCGYSVTVARTCDLQAVNSL